AEAARARGLDALSRPPPEHHDGDPRRRLLLRAARGPAGACGRRRAARLVRGPRRDHRLRLPEDARELRRRAPDRDHAAAAAARARRPARRRRLRMTPPPRGPRRASSGPDPWIAARRRKRRRERIKHRRHRRGILIGLFLLVPLTLLVAVGIGGTAAFGASC